MDSDVILQTNNLEVGYPNKSVCKNINLTLKKGKLTALIGKNGIGKSTLIRTLANLQKPILGTVLLNGKEISKYSISDLSKEISLVLTEKLPPNNLSVFELVALGRQPYTNWVGKLSDDDLQKINQAITTTNIENLIDKKHFELSDGQYQKVLIARALAQNTNLIILDEPTTHLDLTHNVSVLKLLKSLANKNQKAILFSTHDIDLAIQLADEIIVITDDFVVQDTPCSLIEKDVFSKIFSDKNISFDNQKGKFTVN